MVGSLGRALPGILNVALLALLLWTAFAIFGVSLLKGSLSSCASHPELDRVACTGTWGPDSDLSFDSAYCCFFVLLPIT